MDFYKGKTLSIVVGFTTGGGYDVYARLLARFIPDHIPGHPSVILRNQPGAGSLAAARSLNATQPKDGTVMVIFNPGLITRSIVQPDMIDLDFRKLAWVGIATPDFRVCYGYGANGVSSWDDMMQRKEFILGGTGKGSGNYVNGAILRLVFGAPVKQVLGFPGSAEKRIAIERGELDGDCGDMGSIPADWLRDRTAHAFVRFTKERAPEVPESARWIGDFATTQDQKDLLDVLNGQDEVGRSFVVSGDVPADRLAILRKAFNDTMKDPAFIAEAQKARSPMQPLTGEEAGQIVAKIMAASPAVVARAKEIYE
jgi:tripartite-type tricarboxylate transporter receptor subunit TctC